MTMGSGRRLPAGMQAPGGAYYTPEGVALSIAQAVRESVFFRGREPAVILEPNVGGGAFALAAKQVWPQAVILGIDIDPKAPGLEVVDHAFVGSFLSLRALDWIRATTLSCRESVEPSPYYEATGHESWKPDLVLGNPPFEHLTAMVLASFEVCRRDVVFLLRAAALHGADRHASLYRQPEWSLDGFYPLVRRPSFVRADSLSSSKQLALPGTVRGPVAPSAAGSTASCEYAAFQWGKCKATPGRGSVLMRHIL